MGGKKIAAIVAASVGLTLVVGGAVVYVLLLKKPPPPPVEALRAKLLAACDATDRRFAGRRENNRCFSEQASLWSKSEYCDAIELTPGRADRERSNCRATIARETGNIELCKQAGAAGDSDECLRGIAERNEDVSLCLGIQQQRTRDSCIQQIAQATKQSDLCEQVSLNMNRDTCYEGVVRVYGGAATGCARIQDRRMRSQCVHEAARQGRSEACLLLDPDERAACWQLTDTPLDDLGAACGNSITCLGKVAYYGGEACALVPDEKAFERPQCFANLVQQQYGPSYKKRWVRDSVCERQPSPLARDECFAALGRVEGRASACSKVADARLRQNCLFAAGKHDTVACKSLTDALEARRCVAESDLQTTDLSVCRLLDEQKRQACAVRVQSHIDSQVRHGR